MKAILPSNGFVSFNGIIRSFTTNASFQRNSFIVFLASLLLLSSAAKAQVPIVYYDFEKNNVRANGENVVEQEVNAGSSAFTKVGSVSSAITFNNGAGVYNGGSNYGQCISATDWSTSTTNPGAGASKYFQFTVSTNGFSGIKVAFEGQSTSTTTAKIGVAYSTDGVNFTASTTSPISISNSWVPLIYFDFGANADNANNLTIRVYVYGVSSSTARVDIDNMVVLANSQISGVHTLLDYPALGLSLLSGKAMNYPWTDFTVTGTGTEAILPNDMSISGTLTVNSGAILDCGTSEISGGSAYGFGAGTFVLNAGGTLQIGSNEGISASGSTGNIQVGTRSFSVAGIYEYNGTVNQKVGTGVPTNFTGTLVMNNSANKTKVTLASNLTIASGGTLILQAGTFDAGDKKLTMVPGSNIVRSGGVMMGKPILNANLTYIGSGKNNTAEFDSLQNNVTVNLNPGQTLTLDSNLIVTGNMTLTSGTLNLGSSTYTIGGNIVRNGTTQTGVLDASNGTLIFNGSTAQSIPTGSVASTIGNLTVSNASGLTINDNFTIGNALVLKSGSLVLNGNTVTLNGTVTGSGNFKGSSSSGLTIAGVSAVGTLNFDQTTDGSSNALGNLSVSSGSAKLGGKLHLYTALNISGGTMDLAAKNLVLKSNATKTAYVAEIKGTLTGETNVTVERYSPSWSTRRYRVMTSPVMGTTINAAWQEGAKWNGTGTPSSNGYGTLITGQAQGTAAKANANGFDYWSATANSSASIRYYVPAATNTQASWSAVTSTLTPNAFDNNQAYLVYVRGDRSASTGTTAGSTTVRGNGTLKKGSFTISVPNNKSHTLIGNPYASPIDFLAIYNANSKQIQSSFWIWQSSLGTGTGGYVLVRPVTGSNGLYETIPGDGSQTTANRLIHSGEGFFVMPNPWAGSGNSITITEAHKSTTTPSVAVFRQIVTPPAKIYVNLYTGVDSSKMLLDGVLAQYNSVADDTTATLGDGNMQKAVNSSENFSLFQNGSDWIFTSGNTPKSGDTLRFRMWNVAAKDYQLQIRSANFAALGLTPVLVDKYLNKKTVISTADAITNYAFSVTSDAASKDASRFYIVYKVTTTLPLSITGLRAEEKGNTVNVKWNVANETGIKSYEVEKSTKSTSFKTLASVKAKAGYGEQAYVQADGQPSAVNYYRIKMIGTSGEVKYSSVVKVQLQKSGETISTYPNPVSNGSFNLQLTNKAKGTYTVSLYNATGQLVMSKNIQHNGGSATENINLNESVANGSYYLDVKDENGQGKSMNINIQR